MFTRAPSDPASAERSVITSKVKAKTPLVVLQQKLREV